MFWSGNHTSLCFSRGMSGQKTAVRRIDDRGKDVVPLASTLCPTICPLCPTFRSFFAAYNSIQFNLKLFSD